VRLKVVTVAMTIFHVANFPDVINFNISYTL